MEESSKLKIQEPKEKIEIKNKTKEIESELSKDTNNSFSMPIEVKEKEENVEDKDVKMNIEPQSKNGLIIKVFGILSIQLAITLLSVYFFNAKSIKVYMIDEYYETIESLVNYASLIFCFLLISLSIIENLYKIPPYNYIILLVFSICQIILCSFLSFVYYVHYYQTVAMSLLLSIISCVVICLYAFFSKDDLNSFIVFLLVLFGQILVTWFILVFYDVKEFYVLMGFVIAFLLGVYFNYDVQLMNEKNINAYTFHDYIFALLEVYINIVKLMFKMMIFIYKKIFGNININEYINF